MMKYIEWLHGMATYLNDTLTAKVLIDKATELLEKEKEQIKNAYDNGWSNGYKTDGKSSTTTDEDYYTQTYQSK